MSGKTTFLIALAVAGASVATAQTTRVPQPVGHPQIMQAPQVSGKITWKGAPAVKAGDNCNEFKVSAWESVPGTAPAGGINVPGGKDLGITGLAMGNIRQHACSYSISGLPTGKQVYVSVRYSGPMGEGGPSATAHFTLQDKKTASQNVEVSFVTLK